MEILMHAFCHDVLNSPTGTPGRPFSLHLVIRAYSCVSRIRSISFTIEFSMEQLKSPVIIMSAFLARGPPNPCIISVPDATLDYFPFVQCYPLRFRYCDLPSVIDTQQTRSQSRVFPFELLANLAAPGRDGRTDP